MTTGVTRETYVEGVVTGGRGLRSNTSWGAIWAGFFVTLGVETILTLLMIGIFASFVHPGGGSPSGMSFGIGIAVWFFLETLIAYYAGGWVAGMLARKPTAPWNSSHGWAVWGVSTVVITYLLLSGFGPSYGATLNNVRQGLGMSTVTSAIPAPASAPATSVGNTVAAIGRGAKTAGMSGDVAIATWIPIYLFITFACAIGTALAGSTLGGGGSLRRMEEEGV